MMMRTQPLTVTPLGRQMIAEAAAKVKSKDLAKVAARVEEMAVKAVKARKIMKGKSEQSIVCNAYVVLERRGIKRLSDIKRVLEGV